MKLYIQQKVLTLADKFTVKDNAGNDKYFVNGELISIGSKLHVKDASGNEIAFIKQKIALVPTFEVYVRGNLFTVIKKHISLKPSYSLSNIGWEVKGSFLQMDYNITNEGNPIANIKKALVSWGDSYELDIVDDANELTATAVVLAIDVANKSK